MGAFAAVLVAPQVWVWAGISEIDERVILLAARLSKSLSVAHVHWGATLQIRQSEIYASVAAVGGSEQREDGLILIDGQKLPVAERPPFGWQNRS